MSGRKLPGKAAVAMLRAAWENTQPTYVMQDNLQSLVNEGFYKNELIYACIYSTADSASQISLAVRSKKDHSLVPDHPLLDLIHEPNEEMNEFDLWSSTIIYQKTAGRALFEKVRDRAGRVIQLQALRPDYMKVFPGVTTRIGRYFYQPPGTEGATLVPKDVLDIKLFDPLLRYSTKSPLAVLCRAGDVDNAITDFLKLFFENGGAPQGVFMSTSEMSSEDITEARKMWRERLGGYRNWTVPGFLSGEDLKYEQMGSSFKDMGFDALDERDEARICAVLGVPPIIVGARVGLTEATYSNYAQARKAWWEDKLSPMYVNYLDVLGRLLEEIDPSGEHYVDWDFSKVKAFQEENNQRWTRATSALQSGAITRNEYYTEIGLPGMGPRGEVFLMPLNVYTAPKGAPPVKPATEEGGDDAGGKLAPTGPAGHLPHLEEHEMGEGKRNIPADAAERAAAEIRMTKAMQTYFSQEFGRVKEQITRSGIAMTAGQAGGPPLQVIE
jgi:HK97 family phage portal protein